MTDLRRVEHLSKYYYKPILEKVKEAYLNNAKTEYVTNVDIEADVRIIIEAKTDADAESARVGFIDKVMWELEKVED